MKRTSFILLVTAFCLLCLASLALARDVTFEWDANDPTENVTEYRVYEKISGAWVQVASIAPDTTTLTIQGIARTPHIYAATAVNVVGESPMSDEVALRWIANDGLKSSFGPMLRKL